MIIRGRDTFENEVAICCGYVTTKSKRPPVQELHVKNEYRLQFRLTVSAKKIYDPKSKNGAYYFTYDVIICQIPLKATNANMYTACKSLKCWERVEVVGTFRDESFTDDKGNEIVYRVLRVEAITFPERLAALLNGLQTNKKKAKAQSALNTKPRVVADDKYDFN